MSSSPYRVSIQTEDAERGIISQRWARDVIRRALAAEQAPDGSRVEILIAGDETVSALNAEFMGQDGTTDVISFPSGMADSDDDDWPDVDGDSGGDIGQIVLSVPQIARQAETAGMTLREEAAHVLVHATLHLLGHDHELDDDETTMRTREDAILMELIGRPVHGTEPMALAHTADLPAGDAVGQGVAETVSGRTP